MSLPSTLTLAAAAALFAGAAFAQAPAAPAAAPAAAAPAPAAPPSPAAQAFKPIAAAGDMAATLKASGQFSKFLAAADKAGLGPLLSGARPLTLFVPTDAAVEGTPLASIDAMTAQQLQPVLLYHIYGNKITPDQVAGKKGPVQTASNKPIEVDGSATPNKINDSVVLQADVQASNGVIYVLDKPLTPPA